LETAENGLVKQGPFALSHVIKMSISRAHHCSISVAMWYFENNEVFNRCLKLLMPTLVISQGHLPVPRAHPMVASLR